jgi:hypothetical protein
MVVVLPTLESAWITDGTPGANEVTMIHWRLTPRTVRSCRAGGRNFNKAPRLLPIRIQFTPQFYGLSSRINRCFCWVVYNLAKVLGLFVDRLLSNLRKALF